MIGNKETVPKLNNIKQVQKLNHHCGIESIYRKNRTMTLKLIQAISL